MTAPERLRGRARALVAAGYVLGCGGIAWAAAERAIALLPTHSDFHAWAVPACATGWVLVVALVHDLRALRPSGSVVGSSVVAAVLFPLGGLVPVIVSTVVRGVLPSVVGELMILFVATALGSIVWTPVVLVYLVCVYSFFEAQRTLVARPSRDATRRAAWLAAKWTIGASSLASALSWGAVPGIVLGLASAALALGVLAGDLRDVAYLARVQASREPGRAVRRIAPEQEREPLALYLDATEKTVPARVLVAVSEAVDGPFRAGPLDAALFALGTEADARARLAPAALVAVAGIAFALAGVLA